MVTFEAFIFPLNTAVPFSTVTGFVPKSRTSLSKKVTSPFDLKIVAEPIEPPLLKEILPASVAGLCSSLPCLSV